MMTGIIKHSADGKHKPDNTINIIIIANIIDTISKTHADYLEQKSYINTVRSIIT